MDYKIMNYIMNETTQGHPVSRRYCRRWVNNQLYCLATPFYLAAAFVSIYRLHSVTVEAPGA